MRIAIAIFALAVQHAAATVFRAEAGSELLLPIINDMLVQVDNIAFAEAHFYTAPGIASRANWKRHASSISVIARGQTRFRIEVPFTLVKPYDKSHTASTRTRRFKLIVKLRVGSETQELMRVEVDVAPGLQLMDALIKAHISSSSTASREFPGIDSIQKRIDVLHARCAESVAAFRTCKDSDVFSVVSALRLQVSLESALRIACGSDMAIEDLFSPQGLQFPEGCDIDSIARQLVPSEKLHKSIRLVNRALTPRRVNKFSDPATTESIQSVPRMQILVMKNLPLSHAGQNLFDYVYRVGRELAVSAGENEIEEGSSCSSTACSRTSDAAWDEHQQQSVEVEKSMNPPPNTPEESVDVPQSPKFEQLTNSHTANDEYSITGTLEHQSAIGGVRSFRLFDSVELAKRDVLSGLKVALYTALVFFAVATMSLLGLIVTVTSAALYYLCCCWAG